MNLNNPELVDVSKESQEAGRVLAVKWAHYLRPTPTRTLLRGESIPLELTALEWYECKLQAKRLLFGMKRHTKWNKRSILNVSIKLLWRF